MCSLSSSFSNPGGQTPKKPLALKSIVPCRKKHTTILTYTTFQRIIIFDKENNGWKFFVALMNQKKICLTINE